MKYGLHAANPDDVASPAILVRAVYDVLSGTGSAMRDWNRFRTLYAHNARLIPIDDGAARRCNLAVLDVESYIHSRSQILDGKSFFEIEVGHRVQRTGRLAHVLSAYESYVDLDDAPFARGINSVQCYFDDSRWWILSAAWDVSIARTMQPPSMDDVRIEVDA